MSQEGTPHVMSDAQSKYLAVLFASTAALHCAAIAAPATQEQIDALDQKIGILDRKLEIEREESADAAEEATAVTASEDGFIIESGDGAFALKLKGLIQGDARVFADDEGAANDTFLMRRVYPTLEGTIGDFVSFRLMTDFAGDDAALVDAYIDIEALPAAILRGGQFKGPVSLERLQSAGSLHMIERGYPTELAPNREIGVQLYGGDIVNGKTGNPFNYALTFANGAPDGRDTRFSNPDDHFEVTGLLGAEPIENLGFAIAGSYGDKEGGAGEDAEGFLPRYRSPGQETIFEYAATTSADGQHLRWSPQGYYYVGPFGVLAEYIQSELDVTNGTASEQLSHKAAQATAVFVLTGEDASFAGVAPAEPIDRGGQGAWELTARYTWLELDDDTFALYADPVTQVSEAKTWGVGVNWYLTKNLKAVFNYFHTDLDAFGDTVDFPDEKAVLSRLQISF